VQDFLVSSPKDYSWGYATCLFNVPEETYGKNPDDRISVIREFKEMVSGIHNAGFRVVMDVVYNHTWPPQGAESAFWQTVPYYYFRTDLSGNVLNESGVGNAFDDDRPMARKYILDSLLYWQKEYGVDGFRFDLLGMFQKSSVAGWAAALKRQDPGVLLYGEPWTGGGPTRFGKGAQRGLGVGVFNDDFRNVFRGDLDGSAAGFAAGGGADKDALVRAITGSTGIGGFALDPGESINYVSAHDNLTLFDRLGKSVPDEAKGRNALRLSMASVLLSQGVPFLEGGAELGRTTGGNGNSYNAGDAVNQFDWERGSHFKDVSAYLSGLIAVRRAEPGLRLKTADEIQKRVQFADVRRDYVVYTIDESGLGGKHSKLIVVLNGSKDTHFISLPANAWSVLVDGTRATEQFSRVSGRSWSIAPMTANLLAQ
jgi:pullulanase